eukprot:1364422-Karenia_brevis.AAC.1
MRSKSSGMRHSAGARSTAYRGAPSRLALGAFPNKCRFVTWNARGLLCRSPKVSRPKVAFVKQHLLPFNDVIMLQE